MDLGLQLETNFGLQLLQQHNFTGSLVFSPFYLLLSTILVHVPLKEEARNQIRKDLFNDPTNEQLFTICDSLGKEMLAPHNIFKETRLSRHDPKRTAMEMNEFMFGSPEGNSKQFFRPTDFEDEKLIVVSNASFKSAWLDKFNPNMTFRRDFFSSADSKRSVDFLGAYKVYRKYAENDQFQVLSLPYENENLSMNIFLPKNRFGLNEAIKNLDSDTIHHLLLNVSDTYMKVIIPKWKIETIWNLEEVIQNMGIENAFIASDETDYSDVSSFFNKAVIEIDENGSDSTVANTVPSPKSTFLKAKQTKYFIADHPFLFVITSNNHPIFMGLHY